MTDASGTRTPPLLLSAVIITKNEVDRLGRCLASVQGLCSEILVLDCGSDDGTVALARSFGARVEHQDWLGFAGQKNEAIRRAERPWLLLLDADEWLADGSAAQLRALFATGEVERADVWRLKRCNWFLGRLLRGFERTERLVRPDHRYLPMRVHEKPDLAGKRVEDCDIVIEHNTARTLEAHRAKNDRYARLWAEQRHADGKRCSASSPWTHAAAYWLKMYLLRGAWRDGRRGWWFHASHARAVVDKYRHLHALGKRR
ncbi:(heptosyl)LPS beta-1,4-glucosyltransferase [Pseudoxanthomonas japonensis]|uniref:glycosyltransferase family 2 protein n=1 Tax=Pseudoxanthomonas japonensis TaxID=69284 RepID=UPI001DD44DC2|nr:glycosyltransferase family 2 protein [Pseudoxanthomonas japonensis]MBA3929256.1 glycosyltransferase family 2 protein [Xanthomonas sp.]MDR7068295.1 (heptosyl)LPS beta-1,4-glucosyltransferase [Pseudoxanthomonas japonensis]